MLRISATLALLSAFSAVVSSAVDSSASSRLKRQQWGRPQQFYPQQAQAYARPGMFPQYRNQQQQQQFYPQFRNQQQFYPANNMMYRGAYGGGYGDYGNRFPAFAAQQPYGRPYAQQQPMYNNYRAYGMQPQYFQRPMMNYAGYNRYPQYYGSNNYGAGAYGRYFNGK